MKVAIVGTAGRKDDKNRMSRELYKKMVWDAYEQINGEICITHSNQVVPIHLVSGGAAWADHVAVSLYLMNLADSLTLYFPCEWCRMVPGFGEPVGCNRSPGQIANYYHRLFSKKMGGNTLAGIQKTIEKGATYHQIKGGFLARNLLVGQVDILIAYTFSHGDTPKNGGTLHTWNNSKARNKIHRNLFTFLEK